MTIQLKKKTLYYIFNSNFSLNAGNKSTENSKFQTTKTWRKPFISRNTKKSSTNNKILKEICEVLFNFFYEKRMESLRNRLHTKPVYIDYIETIYKS